MIQSSRPALNNLNRDGEPRERDQACFGVYADREIIPDADELARDIGRDR